MSVTACECACKFSCILHYVCISFAFPRISKKLTVNVDMHCKERAGRAGGNERGQIDLIGTLRVL